MKLIMLTALLFSPFAFSYHVIGNGGFAVLCSDKGQQKYYILEEYEIETNEVKTNGASIDWSQAITVEEQVSEYLYRLDPNLRRKMEDYYRVMKIEFVDDLDIYKFNDTNAVLPTPSCQLNLAAYQIHKSFAHRPRVFIDRKIWSQLSLRQQGLLMLHEVVYGYMVINIRNTPVDFDSTIVRKFIVENILLNSAR